MNTVYIIIALLIFPGLPILLTYMLIVKIIKRRRLGPVAPEISETIIIDRVVYAGFWIRLGAFVIDVVTFMFLSYMIDQLLLNSQVSPHTRGIVNDILGLFYSIGFWIYSRWQATPGMHIMKIFVINKKGSRIGLLQGIARHIILYGCFIAGIYSITLLPQDTFTNINTITPQEQIQLQIIGQKQTKKEPITQEEQNLVNNINAKLLPMLPKLFMIQLLICGPYLLFALIVGNTKQKTGLHDLIAGTRVICGYPNKPLLVYSPQ